MLIVPTMFFLTTSFAAQAALLINGDFESGLDGWDVFQDASHTTNNPITGSGSALVGNNITSNFSVIYQTVAVDGTDFQVGDLIELTANMRAMTNNVPFTPAFIEIAFRNGDQADWGSVDDVDFVNTFQAFLGVTDGSVQGLFTGDVEIPAEVTANMITSAVTGIRIAIAMGMVGPNDVPSVAMADDLELTVTRQVPAPTMLLMLGMPLLLLSRFARK